MMDPKKICFISCVNDEKIYKEALFYINHLNKQKGWKVETLCIKDAKSMASAYNQAIKDSDAKYKVYMHQDVFILNKNFIKDITAIFEKYPMIGMIGVAGSKTIPPNGIWWESQHRYGKVYNSLTGEIGLLRFSKIKNEYECVKAIDGLIMITQYDVPWREDIFDGWHFYDISQSIEFQNAGYEVAVPKQPYAWCIHDCGISRIDPAYEKYRKIFLDNYSVSTTIQDTLQNTNDEQKNANIEDIMSIEQNDVHFTGERLVINKEVKNQYNNVLQEHIERYKLACKYVRNKKVLDAACGAGYGAKMLKISGAVQVLGLDISKESLENAEKTYKEADIEFVQGDINVLPFEDNCFDVVVSFETIEHIKDGSKWIAESARVIKDNGLFIVSTPNRDVTNPGTYIEERPLNPYHQYEYTISEFAGELLKHYEIIDLFGQTIIKNNDLAVYKILRQLRKLDENYIPDTISVQGHCLIPLSEIKNAQPMYVVAVCKKRTIVDLEQGVECVD